MYVMTPKDDDDDMWFRSQAQGKRIVLNGSKLTCWLRLLASLPLAPVRYLWFPGVKAGFYAGA